MRKISPSPSTNGLTKSATVPLAPTNRVFRLIGDGLTTNPHSHYAPRLI
jgi:hypothetical protein